MKTHNKFKRSALALAIGLTVAGGAFAQSSVGSIYGHADSSAAVTIENTATGAKRTITSNEDGRFSFTQLPSGRYKVTAGGVTREVTVNAGVGSQVEFKSTQLEEIVVGAEAINPIDLSSVESATVFTAEQIQKIPVGRDITNVALLAPGTVKGDTGFGNLASFGGSSVAENGYYINGFDVTNIRNFISYASLPFEAIAEQGVKTGGYGAEYGRSLGGVISLITKRGSNEWEFGASAYWAPSSLREDGKDVFSRDPDRIGSDEPLLVYRSADEADGLKVNLYGGGALIQDRLFFFGLVEARNDSTDIYNNDNSTARDYNEPNGMVKLDWNITDNHMVEFTGIHNRSDYSVKTYTSADFYPTSHETLSDSYDVEEGGDILIGKYTGYLTDNFTLSLQAGQLKNTNAYRTSAAPGEDCVAAYDSTAGGLAYTGCWNEAAFTVRDAAWGPDEDKRNAYRIDGEWGLGDHLVRFGYDYEKFTSGAAGLTYSGGEYYRYFRVGASGNGSFNGETVNIGANNMYVRYRNLQTTSASYDVYNEALYLEDTWQFNDTLSIYGGLRAETFDNRNNANESFVKADNQIAPRLGFSWDAKGDQTLKVFGTAGRYFIPVATNTNIRAAGGEVLVTEFFRVDGFDPNTGLPIGLGAQLGPSGVNGSLEPPVAETVAAANLKPMYQDEFILGTQFAIGDNWTMGLKGIRRDVKDGMDDHCSHQGAVDWAEDNGYDNFDWHTMASCYLINPGRDTEIALDLEGDGNLTVVTIPASYFGLPEYQRSYNALELFFERTGGDGWALQGSYTISHSYGNVEGYVNSTLEQDDAGLTQDFDHYLFEDGAFGDLPNDRRHALKLFGSYEINDEWRVGGNLLVQSGRPVNCNGYIPLAGTGVDQSGLSGYSGSSFYCRDTAGNRVLTQRGDFGRTPWTNSIDASVAYIPGFADGKLTVQMDVFNLFNNDSVTEYNEAGDISANSVTLSPDFLNDVNYQAPRSVRFSARYDF